MVVRPRRILVVAAALALLALSACNPADQYPRRVPPPLNATYPFVFNTLGGMVIAGSGDVANPIALTFDDGPSSYSESIVSILRDKHVPATFFVIGIQVAGREQIIRDEVQWGNRVAAHSWTHTDLTTLSGADLQREIDWSSDVLTPFLGDDPTRCLRPPGGNTNTTVHRAIGAAGLGEALWSIDPRDWERPAASTIVNRVVGAAFPGAIILLHDGGGNRANTVAALPAIIDQLHARGYTFVSIC